MSLAKLFPIDFFLHYPLMSYLRSTIPHPGGAYAGIFMNAERTALMIKATGKLGLVSYYNYAAEGYTGAPGQTEEVNDSSEEVRAVRTGGNTPFRRELLGKHKADRDGKFTIIFDTAEGYFGLHTLDPRQFSKNEEFRRILTKETIEIVPTWTDTQPYEWALLDQEFRPVNESQTNEQVFVVGLPVATIRPLIDWTSDQTGLLEAIIPTPIAIAAWFLHQFHASDDPAFLVYSHGAHTVVFFFVDKKCVHVRRSKESLDALVQNVGDITSEMEALLEERMISSETVSLFVWEGGDGGWDMTEALGQKIWPNNKCVRLNNSTISEKQTLTYAGDIHPDAYVLDWAVNATA